MSDLFDCDNPRALQKCCDGKVLKLAEITGSCPEFDLCLPFGARLYTKDGYLLYSPPSNPPTDGEYNRIIIQGGCIVGLENSEYVPIYTQAPCVELACRGGDGGSMPECCPKSNVACNLYDINPTDGLPVVRLHVDGGGQGLRLEGCGTAESPLKIVAGSGGESAEGGALLQGEGIVITGGGTTNNPWVVSHYKGGSHDRNIGGVSVDQFGHVLGAADGGGTDDGCLCIQQVISPDGTVTPSYDPTTKILSLKASGGGGGGGGGGTNERVVVKAGKNVTVWRETREGTVTYTVNADVGGEGGGGGGGGKVYSNPIPSSFNTLGGFKAEAYDYASKSMSTYYQSSRQNAAGDYYPTKLTFNLSEASTINCEVQPHVDLGYAPRLQVYIDGNRIDQSAILSSAPPTIYVGGGNPDQGGGYEPDTSRAGTAVFSIMNVPAGSHTLEFRHNAGGAGGVGVSYYRIEAVAIPGLSQ